MIELLQDPQAWASLLTLTALEIVLGIDNVIFLSIVTARLPLAQQPLARRLGLGLAAGMRILLLLSITWIIGLTEPLATVWGYALSWRDVVLICGGLFLLVKGTMEIHHMTEGERKAPRAGRGRIVRSRHHPDHDAGYRLLSRFGDYRGRHGATFASDDRSGADLGRDHAPGSETHR